MLMSSSLDQCGRIWSVIKDSQISAVKKCWRGKWKLYVMHKIISWVAFKLTLYEQHTCWLRLKGGLKRRCLNTVFLNCWYFRLLYKIMVVPSLYIYTHSRSTFLLWILSSLGYSLLGLLLWKKVETVDLGCNTHFCHTYLPCSWRHRHGLPNTKWQHSRVCFHNFKTSVVNKLDHKLTENLLQVFCVFFHFYQLGPIMLFCLVSP